jgi:hypothetical protein
MTYSNCIQFLKQKKKKKWFAQSLLWLNEYLQHFKKIQGEFKQKNQTFFLKHRESRIKQITLQVIREGIPIAVMMHHYEFTRFW